MSNETASAEADFYGQLVRVAWVRWAEKQPNPKPSWLVPWKELSEVDKQADREIGEFVRKASTSVQIFKLERQVRDLQIALAAKGESR